MAPRYLFLVFIFVIGGMSSILIGQTKTYLSNPKIFLIIKNKGLSLQDSQLVINPKENFKIDRRADSLIIHFNSELKEASANWRLNWQIKEKTGKSIMPNKDGTYTVKDTFDLAFKVLQDSLFFPKKWNFGKSLGYSIIPGGGRFHTGHPWQGGILGALQVVPIPLAIYFNHQRQKFLDMSEDAARQGDQQKLDEYFNKSQDSKKYARIAIGAAAIAYLINILDAMISVKEFELSPSLMNNGVRLNLSKKI